MKAVAITHYKDVVSKDCFVETELTSPTPNGRDLLVEVKAVSVNPVDTKVRKPKDKVEDPARVLGWDAAGVVVGVGPDCSLFKVGDEVFYACDSIDLIG